MFTHACASLPSHSLLQVTMSVTTLFFLAVLSTYVLALPTAQSSVLRRHYQLVKMSTSTSLQSLFPNGQGSSVWSTASSVAKSVGLTTEAFKPIDMLDNAKPIFAKAPDGADALQIHFNKGK